MKKGIKEITQKISASVLATIMMFSVFSTTISLVIPKMVYAAETNSSSDGNNYTLHAIESRYNGAKSNLVRIDGSKIWDYYADNDTVADYYCLKGHTNINYTDENYYRVNLVSGGKQEAVDDVLNNINKVPNSIVFKGDSKKAIKSLQWLAKNMYNVKGDIKDAESKVMKNNLQTIINKYGGDECKNTKIEDITEEQIGVIQQFVVWQFVEHSQGAASYYGNILTLNDIKTRFTTNSVNYYSEKQANEAYAIYKSLLNAATRYGNDEKIYSIANVSSIKGLNISKTGDEVETISENKYRIGPIKVTSEDNISIIKSIADGLKITGVTDVQITNYVCENNTKTPEEFKILDVLEKEYYVEFTTAINIENKDISYSVTPKYKSGIKECNSYMYLKSNSKQPILGTKNTYENPKGQAQTVKYEKPHDSKIDIALTKTITNIEDKHGKDIPISGGKRLVGIDNSQLVAGKANAKYEMNKNALLVSPGDIITYQLTVYNEGSDTAYVKEITDYIPEGLELVPAEESEINSQYGCQAGTSTNGYTPVTIKLQGEGNTTRRELAGRVGEEVSSTFVNVELKVANTAKIGTRLTNIAEVTVYGAIDDSYPNREKEARKGNEEVVDTDSEEATIENVRRYNTDIETRISIYGDEGTKKVDGKRTGIDKNDLVDEDDEDFEVVMVGRFDLALRKFITKVNR